MDLTLDAFNVLTDAEEYFQFFQLPYDAQVVNVNRLHILRKFSRFVQDIDQKHQGASPDEKLSLYKAALEEAYSLFLSSTPLEQKLFKVFKQKPSNVVMLSDIGGV